MYVCVPMYIHMQLQITYVYIICVCVQILCVCVFVPVYRFTSAKYEKAVFVKLDKSCWNNGPWT